MAVDTAEGIISYIQADFADSRDSQYLTDISLQVQNRLRKYELIMTDFQADAGYSNSANYDFLEQRKVTEWIPVFGKYKPKIEGFPNYLLHPERFLFFFFIVECISLAVGSLNTSGYDTWF